MGGVDTSDSAQPVGGVPANGPAKVPLRIFINYRHQDIPFAAMMLYRELRSRFGKEDIFFDKGTLLPGMRFPGEIKSHLTDGAGAFIALIGSKWTTTMLAHRQRDDEDYVTKEIELALLNGWTIIPVLVDDASLPDPLQLSPAIRALPDCQAARFRQTNLDDDVEELVARLNEIGESKTIVVGMPPRHSGTGGNGGNGTSSDVDSGSSRASDVPPADDEHYRMLVEEADNLVIFLGAGANADDHERPFQQGAAMLPDDTDLAEYLAAKVSLKSGQRDLAEVAQYVRMIRGEPRVFQWVKDILGVDTEPGVVHRYLARLPRRLEELGLEKRYQMIVTPKFDVALEKAFREEGEPFDVAVYMAQGTEYAGKFVHLPWGFADPRPIPTPNEYTDFPFVTDYGELTRTVIVKVNGAIDDLATGYRWKNNFVITEDHYIDYLGGRVAEEVVPTQILAKLRQASCLFIGYTIADWRLRVFLHWIWHGEKPSAATHWAVERDPDVLERQFWQRSGVCLYQSRLNDYVHGFDRFLTEHLSELT
jgi:SIR2-like domain/TIR domain